MSISPAYTVIETLHEDQVSVIYRGVRASDGHRVIIKALGPRWQARDLERLKNEYELGIRLDVDAVLRPLALSTQNGTPILVLDDYGGYSLAELRGQLDLRRFLRVAIGLAGALSSVHARGVVHKDIKPKNAVIHPATDEVRLLDLGLASLLPQEVESAERPTFMEGSLPYLSPEQTGRTNWAVDARTDLYSLGITLYELYAGRLPFEASDPLGWIHCHLARTPVSLDEAVPGTPAVLSQIVLRLLAKSPDDRYRSARGLEFDLGQCLDRLLPNGQIAPFLLGQRDVSDRFQIPQRLYGRDLEVRELVSAFDRVVELGTPELFLLSGYAGIGKTSLIKELHKPITRERGFFLFGKFDQLKRDIPYGTIAQAFRNLVLDILTENDEEVERWRTRIRTALGMNGNLIAAIIPELDLLIGEQPEVPELPLGEAQKRFHLVFRQFLDVFAQRDHPLALVLDDLQWADSASRTLLRDLLTHPDVRYVLAVGTYRDNEVDAADPLMREIDAIRKAGTRVHEMVVPPLSREDLGQLVADTMLAAPGEVAPLSQLLWQKTAGNPFFAIQFLQSLKDDGHIRFDPTTLSWRCEISSALARAYTDNVVDFMVGKLRRLSPSAQALVELVASFGNVVDMPTLSLMCDRSTAETERDLSNLVLEGILVRSADTYRFAHDRVQQAAYALIPKDGHAHMHLRIGRTLLAHTPPERKTERLFDIVNQLNLGIALVENIEERYRLAELDLAAGRRARAAAAYGPAAKYLAASMAALPSGAWESRYPLAFAVYLERARCEYLNGDFAEAGRCLAQVLPRAESRVDKAAVYRLMVELYITSGEIDKAIDVILACATLFGRTFQRHPSEDSIHEAYGAVVRALGGRPIEELLELPPMCDADVRAFMDVLEVATPATYFFDERLHFALVSEAAKLSMRHGNCPSSATAYGSLGMLIGPLFGEYRDAYRFGKAGHDLVERDHLWAQKAKACAFLSYIVFWVRHLNEVVPYLEEGLRAGAATGDLTFASYAACTLVSILLARGDPLDDVTRELGRVLAFVQRANYADVEDVILTQRRFILHLRGHPRDSAGVRGDDDEEERQFERRIEQRIPIATCWYFIRKLQEHFLFGDYREALQAADRASELLWTTRDQWESCEYTYYLALTLSQRTSRESAEERKDALVALSPLLEQHRGWAENCPANFENRCALLRAEMARLSGDIVGAMRLYEQAIASARDHGFLPNQAIANELAARFYEEEGFATAAQAYWEETRSCYARWGADAKVRELERAHPSLAVQRTLPPVATYVARQEQLELLSVMKASQSIAKERRFAQLARALIRVVIEQGGAQRGALVLLHDGRLFVEAEAEVTATGIDVELPAPPRPVSAARVPRSVVQYVARTGRRVMLDCTSSASPFAEDEYLAKAKPRSLLALPLVGQGEVVGLVYLENDIVAGAFTANRLGVLELLASQAAISLTDTRLLASEHAAREAAERAEGRSALLAEASVVLAESLDCEKILGGLAQLLVKKMGDWCEFDLIEDGHCRRVAYANSDASRLPLLRELEQRYAPSWNSVHPQATVIRTRRPLLLAKVTDQVLEQTCVDKAHQTILRELGTKSAMVVPLISRGQLLGVVTVCSAAEDLSYGDADLSLLVELARRAATAIDNTLLYRQAKKAIRLRDDFLSIASHELRTPMTSLMLSLEALAQLPGRAFQASLVPKLLLLAEKQGVRMGKLIDDLLDVSRIEAGRVELRRGATDLGELVAEVLGRFEEDLTQAACTTSVRTSGTVVGQWDRERLEQVFSNLLANAIKFGRGHAIEISIGREARCAVVSITDHGIGIALEHQARIFQRFERAVSPDDYGGLGLGLHICRGLVEAHGGSISVCSLPGAGATFTVRLPCTLPGESEARSSMGSGPACAM